MGRLPDIVLNVANRLINFIESLLKWLAHLFYNQFGVGLFVSNQNVFELVQFMLALWQLFNCEVHVELESIHRAADSLVDVGVFVESEVL